MLIGDRLRALREERKLSQGEIAKRTGLIRSYVSRVEHGHTVPSLSTLEKFARAFEIPLYQVFYEGVEPPQLPAYSKQKGVDEAAWGSFGKDARLLRKFYQLLSRMDETKRQLLLHIAQKMAQR